MSITPPARRIKRRSKLPQFIDSDEMPKPAPAKQTPSSNIDRDIHPNLISYHDRLTLLVDSGGIHVRYATVILYRLLYISESRFKDHDKPVPHQLVDYVGSLIEPLERNEITDDADMGQHVWKNSDFNSSEMNGWLRSHELSRRNERRAAYAASGAENVRTIAEK